MTPLRRHQIAWLSDLGWSRVLARHWDETARACLAHWARRRLPLVVTRQRAGGMLDEIALGLPAPGRWHRQRIALVVARSDVLFFDEFPRAPEVVSLLPCEARAAWRSLCAGLASCRAGARVYGSHGWQHLSGLDHLRSGSDIDLWVAVSDAQQADAVVVHLAAYTAAAAGPRVDGELILDDGAAVAWREWADWRAGRSRGVLVKRVDGVALACAPFWRTAREVAEAAQ